MIHTEVSQVLDAQRPALAERIVTRIYNRHPGVCEPAGEGRAKSLQDVSYHLSYLAEAVAASDPSLFVDYAAWVKMLFAGLGLPEDALTVTLECTRAVLGDALPDDAVSLVDEYLQAGLEHVRRAPDTPPTFIGEDPPLVGLARRYLEALLRGEREVASRLVLEALENGANVKDIYLHVFQPVQREVGRLWQMNQVSVAQEHYCTAATQLIMSQLYPYIFATEKIGRRLVAACVDGELHEIGVRMVADFFEMEGWDTYYIGANAPTGAILRTLVEREPDVLGVSATIAFHVRAVADLIEQVRASDVGTDVKILVGGYPFNTAPDLWRRVGADGCARDAQGAVDLAHRLVGEGR